MSTTTTAAGDSTSDPSIITTSPGTSPATLTALKSRLRQIATDATTAAEAIDVGRCDFLDGELSRHLGRLDVLGMRLADVCEHLAAGVDPQGAPAAGACPLAAGGGQ
jgi:hypothetical protein